MRKRSLQSRILILVAIGIVLLLCTIGAASWLAVRASIDRLLSERLVLAQATADNLERSLHIGLRSLGNTVEPRFDPRDGMADEERAMTQASADSIYGDGVFLLDAAGRPLAHVPPGTRTIDPRTIAEPVKQALEGRAAMTNVVELGRSGRKIVAGLLPLHGRDGRVVGVVGGGIDLTGNRLRELIQTRAELEGSEHEIDIIDATGTVLASTDSQNVFQKADHRSFMAEQIGQRRSTVVECHSCHEERPRREIMAISSLESIPWAVAIRQERGTVLGPAITLRNTLIVIGLVFLAGAGAVALATVRSVVRPIRALQGRVRAITEGDLDAPVPHLGDDEIGDLGRHVESMRRRLRDSLAEIRGWNDELEREVRKRTAELRAAATQNEALYLAMQEKEEARGQLLHKLIAAQEAERKRVARELHDSTSQELAALVLRLDAFRAANAASPGIADAVDRIKQLAVGTLNGIHHLIFDLRPAMLDDLGLAPALRWLIAKQFEGRPIDARFELSGEERRLQPELETTLFRLAQEATSNVARHAQASQVVVSLAFERAGITLEIEDDGVGFDPKQVEAESRGPASRGRSMRGLGLLGMRERVELWDGALVVDSAPEQGTRIDVFVPYPAARTRTPAAGLDVIAAIEGGRAS